MFNIHISVQADSNYIDIPPGEIENTELTIEDLVSSVFLELFGTVRVENVTLEYTSSSIDIEIPEEKSLIYIQSKSTNDIEKSIEANIKNKILAEPFSTKRVKSVVLEREEPTSSSVVDKALKIARDRSLALEREPISSTIINISIMEEPLTAQNFTTIMTALTQLHTKCWLIKQDRLADLIEYTETGNIRFTEEANLIIVKLTHNSPAEIKLNMGIKDIAEAFKESIDAVAQAPIRLEEGKLKNQALAVDTKLKEQETQSILADKEQSREIEAEKAQLERQKTLLEVEKQKIEIEKELLALQKARLELEIANRNFAFETADMMVQRLYPDADQKTKLILSRTLVPNLLQLTSIKGLKLVLPEPQDTQEENQ